MLQYQPLIFPLHKHNTHIWPPTISSIDGFLHYVYFNLIVGITHTRVVRQRGTSRPLYKLALVQSLVWAAPPEVCTCTQFSIKYIN